MSVYGGRRFDFRPPTYTLALNEDWPLRWTIQDEDGVDLTSFGGLTWGWALLDRLDTANGWTAVLAAALISKTSALATITASVPNVDLTVTAAQQAAAAGGALTVRPYAYELWQLTSPVRRVAYGLIMPQH